MTRVSADTGSVSVDIPDMPFEILVPLKVFHPKLYLVVFKGVIYRGTRLFIYLCKLDVTEVVNEWNYGKPICLP